MAKAYSSRKRPGGRTRIKSTESKPKSTPKAATNRSDFSEILGRFSDGLALVETAYSALETAQEDETPIGPGVVTLQRGIDELKGVYTELDLAISRSK